MNGYGDRPAQGSGCLKWFIGVVLTLWTLLTLQSFAAYLASGRPFLTALTTQSMMLGLNTISDISGDNGFFSTMLGASGVSAEDLAEIKPSKRIDAIAKILNVNPTNAALLQSGETNVEILSTILANAFLDKYYPMPLKEIFESTGAAENESIPAEVRNSPLSAEKANRLVGTITLIMTGIALALMAALIGMNRGFSRLSAPGTVLFFASIPGLFAYVLLYQTLKLTADSEVPETALAEPVLSLFKSAYLIPFAIGLAFMIAGIVGKALTPARKPDDFPPPGQPPIG